MSEAAAWIVFGPMLPTAVISVVILARHRDEMVPPALIALTSFLCGLLWPLAILFFPLYALADWLSKRAKSRSKPKIDSSFKFGDDRDDRGSYR